MLNDGVVELGRDRCREGTRWVAWQVFLVVFKLFVGLPCVSWQTVRPFVLSLSWWYAFWSSEPPCRAPLFALLSTVKKGIVRTSYPFLFSLLASSEGNYII